MLDEKLLRTTAILGALGIAAAAFGAHGLEKIAGPAQIRWWAIAVAMHLVTAPVLLFVSQNREKTRALCGVLLLAGVMVFSGSLYLMALGAPRILGAVTPLVGVLLIAGWLLLAWPPSKGESEVSRPS